MNHDFQSTIEENKGVVVFHNKMSNGSLIKVVQVCLQLLNLTLEKYSLYKKGTDKPGMIEIDKL
jgi:hypothetical protein